MTERLPFHFSHSCIEERNGNPLQCSCLQNPRQEHCTLGRVDQGGGGTVAAIMGNRNIVTVDAGVPVLSMHAPMEIISKLDCYMSMRACKAVYED